MAGVLRLVCTGTAAEAAKAIDDASLQGYTLDVTPQAVTIEAITPMGVFYGIQSVRQLLTDGRQMQCTHIVDQPRFTYRGLMLDCSRHFWPLDYLKRQVDALAYFKMDRLHLHLTDGGGWRLEIEVSPAYYRSRLPYMQQLERLVGHFFQPQILSQGRRGCLRRVLHTKGDARTGALCGRTPYHHYPGDRNAGTQR